MPRQIRDTVRRYALAHDLLRPGPLVVAVSGGADSTALLLLVADLAPELGLVLHVAHFDHRIRRAGAADAQFVSDLAASAGATVRIGRAETKPRSEDEARRARYAFLRRVASERNAAAIATGHTRDDQAETLLLHMTRGSGIAGLAGMRPSRDGITRPLLCIGRAETAAICVAAAIAPCEDPTNRSLRYARNRIRRRVLPELAAIDPQVTTALARLADAAAEVADSMHERAAEALETATGEGAIDLDGLAEDPAIRKGALSLAWERATGQILAARHRDALLALAARRDGSSSLDLPGGRALREYGTLRIEAGAREPDPGDAADLPLTAGATVEWEGWRMTLQRSSGAPNVDDALIAIVPAADAEGLVVRSRRSGDRMAGGVHTKVQDLLTDAKIPARERSRVPLVVRRDGTVGWIPGVASAWNGVSDGYVLVAYPPSAWRMPAQMPRSAG